MCFNTTGQNNTAVGSNTLQTNTTGDNNTALGIGSLFNNIDGQNNTAIGLNAGKLHSGNNNTFLGANTDSGSDSYINSTAIGYGSQIDSSNQIKMGVADTLVSISSAILTNTDPASYSAATSIVPKSYVDSFSSGITITDSCAYATTTNIDLATGGLLTIDGYVTSVGDRVLVKSQNDYSINNVNTSDVDNGIYIVASGAWTRATDYPVTGTDVLGYLTFVINGTLNGKTAFAQIADPGTVGTTVLQYSIFYSSPFQLGDGLSLSGAILNVDAALTGFLTFVGINGGSNTSYSLDSGTKNILVNGVTVGKGVGTGAKNTAVGQYALQANTTGQNNTALGYQALHDNINGQNNTAVGVQSLTTNTSGTNNTALGYQALRYNTDGGNNTAVGQNALYTNTSGLNNTALGYQALRYNTTGVNNTAVGVQSLTTNTSGTNNTALGLSSLIFNTTGSFNTAIGTTALQHNSYGIENTAIGYQALQTNITGNYNTAVGKNALYSNTGGNNTALGVEALFNNIGGTENTAVGLQALQNNTTGQTNTAVGNGALFNNTISSNNTALGYIAGYNLTTGSNVTCIGYNAQSSGASDEIILGDSHIAFVRSAGAYTTLSDARDKKDIVELKAGLDFVEKLKPVSFTWNMRDGGKVDIPDTGFIAQDLKQVQIDTGIDIPYLVYEPTPEKMEACYSKLLPVLVKAIQDLKKEVDELRGQITK
jgi:hypothetical protein